MNLGQFKILLEKINSLHSSMSLDGNISKIEQDLMKSYVSQLYEACVSTEESGKTIRTISEQKSTPTPDKVYTSPAVETPITKSVETPKVEELPQVKTEPIQKYEPQVQNQSTPNVQHVPQTQNQAEPTAQLNEQVNKGPKTLNERLAESQNKTVSTNDKFKVESKPKAAYKPPIIIDVDHLKGGGNSTPPPPPPPKPIEQAPIAKPTPTYTAPSTTAKESVGMQANNIAEYFNLHNQKKITEVSDRLSTAPLTDLTKAIGLNDKISMIRELWADDQFAFNNSLNQLNTLNSFAEAKNFVMENCVGAYGWDDPKKISRAKQFIDLLRRRYPA